MVQTTSLNQQWLHEIVKDLARKPFTEQPADFQELHNKITKKIMNTI